MFSRNTMWAIGGGVLFAILISLLGWFLFIRTQNENLAQTTEGRGFGTDIPSFESGPVGSTNQNIRDTLLSGFGLFSGNGGSEENAEEVRAIPRLWNPSSVPAGGIAVMGTSTQTKIQFVERPSGNIFESNLSDGNVTRVSNTLIPNVYQTYWAGDEVLVMQHLDESGDVATLLGTVLKTATSTEETPATTFEGSYLEPDIVSVATTQESDEIFYIVKTTTGSVGIITSIGDDSARRIFTSRLSGWRSKGINENTILLFQNASQGTEGSAFLLQKNSERIPLQDNIRGLITAISGDEAHVLFNNIVEGRITLFSKMTDGPQREVPLTTFAEKCVFSPLNSSIAYCAVPREIPNAQLPDAWYRGEVHFSDDWWIVDMSTGLVEQLISPESDYGVSLDVIDPTISNDGAYIVFLDALTRTPWVLRVVQ